MVGGKWPCFFLGDGKTKENETKETKRKIYQLNKQKTVAGVELFQTKEKTKEFQELTLWINIKGTIGLP